MNARGLARAFAAIELIRAALRGDELLLFNQRLVDDRPEIGAGGAVPRLEDFVEDFPDAQRLSAGFQGSLDGRDEADLVAGADGAETRGSAANGANLVIKRPEGALDGGPPFEHCGEPGAALRQELFELYD